MDGPSAQGSLSLTALRAEGCGLPCRAMLIKSALRDLSFSVIWYDEHYGNQPPPVAFPPLVAGATTFPPAERWDNKAPQSNPFISRTTISTGYSAPACGGSPAKRARGNAFPTPAGRLYGFIQTGAFYQFIGALQQPSRQRRVKLKPLKNLRPSGPSTFKPHRGLSI